MTTKKTPRVSIGIPVYNGARYVGEAIGSVLAQTFSDFELIICDNASTDGTQAACEALAARDERVRYYRNERNLGAARNFNRAFDLARGEYFKWLAADDLVAPSYIERCVEALNAAPGAVLAYTQASGIDPDGRLLKDCRHSVDLALQIDPVERFRLFRERSGFSAWPMLYIFAMMRVDALRRTRLHGTYINSDNCLIYELLFLGSFCEVPERLSFFRQHAGSSSTYALDRGTRQRFFNPDGHHLARLVGHRRLYIEYLLAIGRSPMSLSQKLRIAAYNVSWALTKRREDVRAGFESLLAPP